MLVEYDDQLADCRLEGSLRDLEAEHLVLMFNELDRGEAVLQQYVGQLEH